MSAARRYLTAAIFPVYILLVMVTVATCLLSYEAIRRVPRAAAGRSGGRTLPAARRLAAKFAVPQDIN